MGESTLVLLRHGESQGNADGIFTGLMDVPITELGQAEAIGAAGLLAAAELCPPVWFCSPMLRTTQTADLLRDALGDPPVELELDWRLAERNYGALTGRTKTDVHDQFGAELFRTWRRSLNVAPPAMTPAQRADLGGEAPGFLGLTESLADVVLRVGSLWRQRILPALDQTGSALVIAHGNSLRALCTVLDDLDEAEVRELNLPTGQPLVYRIDPTGRPVVRGGEYLDPANAHAAAAVIASQGGT